MNSPHKGPVTRKVSIWWRHHRNEIADFWQTLQNQRNQKSTCVLCPHEYFSTLKVIYSIVENVRFGFRSPIAIYKLYKNIYTYTIRSNHDAHVFFVSWGNVYQRRFRYSSGTGWFYPWPPWKIQWCHVNVTASQIIATGLFVQQLILLNKKENTICLHYWSYVREPVNLPRKGPVMSISTSWRYHAQENRGVERPLHIFFQ